MSLARLALLASCFGLAAALGAAACSASSTDELSHGTAGSPASPDDAGADDADAAATALAISFTQNGTLTLNPKEARELVVQATPAGIFKVRFALLGSTSGDAALSANEVSTDESGVARVELTAPSTPTTFNVRASIDTSVQARIAVSVSARNFTTLRVLPSYNGKRAIGTWTATASAGVSCASLTGDPPPDGDLSTSAAPGKPLEIEQVPVGVPLAVTLRAGHYAGGCTDQAALSEGDGNQVLVYAIDRPINLEATKLDVAFGPTNPTSAFEKAISAASSDITTSLSGGQSSDVTALLDAMQLTAVSKNAFVASRQTYAWDSALASAFGGGADTRLRTPVNRWLTAGLANFYGANTFTGTLEAHGSGASFEPQMVAGVTALSAGFPESVAVTWSADSSDTLSLGFELDWRPSRLLAALALSPANAEFPGTTTVEGALAQSVDCALVGQTLAAHGSAPNTAYPDCDGTCIAESCTQALASVWQTATNASSVDARLTVSGAGPATVADDAAISQLAGSWLGQLVIAETTAPAGGPFSAKTKD